MQSQSIRAGYSLGLVTSLTRVPLRTGYNLSMVTPAPNNPERSGILEMLPTDVCFLAAVVVTVGSWVIASVSNRVVDSVRDFGGEFARSPIGKSLGLGRAS